MKVVAASRVSNYGVAYWCPVAGCPYEHGLYSDFGLGNRTHHVLTKCVYDIRCETIEVIVDDHTVRVTHLVY